MLPGRWADIAQYMVPVRDAAAASAPSDAPKEPLEQLATAEVHGCRSTRARAPAGASSRPLASSEDPEDPEGPLADTPRRRRPPVRGEGALGVYEVLEVRAEPPKPHAPFREREGRREAVVSSGAPPAAAGEDALLEPLVTAEAPPRAARHSRDSRVGRRGGPSRRAGRAPRGPRSP
jgi:hypothetical protein